MSFVRPEARAALARWGEALAGGAAALIGLWWALGVGGLLGLIGWAVAALGLAATFAGIQRARFRRGSGGPGIVRVTEGRIAYFGPLTGGVADLASLDTLALDHEEYPAHWVLDRPGEPPLHIPVTAEGADSLFDAFAALPGLSTERVLRALDRPGPGRVTLWRRGGPVHTSLRLH